MATPSRLTRPRPDAEKNAAPQPAPASASDWIRSLDLSSRDDAPSPQAAPDAPTSQAATGGLPGSSTGPGAGAPPLDAAEAAQKAALEKDFGPALAALGAGALSYLVHIKAAIGEIPQGLGLEQLAALDISLAMLEEHGARSLAPPERSSLFMTPQTAEIAEEHGIRPPPEPSWTRQMEQSRELGARRLAEPVDVDPYAPVDVALREQANKLSRSYLIESMDAQTRAQFDQAVRAESKANLTMGGSIGLAALGIPLAPAAALAGVAIKLEARHHQQAALASAQAQIQPQLAAPGMA